ncbi:M20/M25/M40 family metallo-hydrolase [Pleomorphovibrio marinus]|uniref:M20/M25/M40 family metallo-hydrolase n=1 Tax=Pleomorphovibrio marinus TaxID=2164132 RepID=UPI000E0C16D6|nr:M20/M25/M40 family metallo-hydrolase [Pleomorphovibrio marinus]
MQKPTLTLSFLLFSIIHLYAQENLPQRLERHVQVLASDSLEGRGLGTEGRQKAIRYIENEMREMGLQPFQEGSYFHYFDFRANLVQLKGKNVVGMIPGAHPELKEEYIVIGAHFDHLGYKLDEDGPKTIFPGADDNASGVAGILEIARLILAFEEQPQRSLVFVAFDAEESGLIGSEYFVNAQKPFSNDAIKAMFSLDMIGMFDTVNKLKLKGWQTLENADELLALAQGRQEIPVKTKFEIERATDTWPFGKVGIPAIYVSTGLKSPYHQPEDTADLLDYEGMAKISSFMTGLILEMANSSTMKPSRIFDAKSAKYGKPFRFGAQIGIGASRNINRTDSYREFGVLAVEAGIYSRVRISPTFEVTVSTLYDLNGSLVEGERFRRHSITVPALVRVTPFYSKDGLFRIFTGVGPYFRQHLRQRLSEGAQQGLGSSVELPDQEWGLSLQLGFQVFMFTLSTEWRSGLTEPLRLPGATEIYNRNFRLGIAYEF